MGQQYEKDFSVLTGPIPECTLAFTHEIGNEVGSIRRLFNIIQQFFAEGEVNICEKIPETRSRGLFNDIH